MCLLLAMYICRLVFSGYKNPKRELQIEKREKQHYSKKILSKQPWLWTLGMQRFFNCLQTEYYRSYSDDPLPGCQKEQSIPNLWRISASDVGERLWAKKRNLWRRCPQIYLVSSARQRPLCAWLCEVTRQRIYKGTNAAPKLWTRQPSSLMRHSSSALPAAAR